MQNSPNRKKNNTEIIDKKFYFTKEGEHSPPEKVSKSLNLKS